MSRAMPLYLMLKPLPTSRRVLRRCVTTYGLDASYGPEKYHCTLLHLGESQTWSSGMLADLLRMVDAEPCSVGFDAWTAICLEAATA